MSNVDYFNAKFTAQTIKDLGDNEITVDLSSIQVSYKVPAHSIDIAELMEKVGTSTKLSDVKIEFSVTEATEAQKAAMQKIAQSCGYEVVSSPMNFAITAISGKKVIEIDRLKSYASRYIKLTEEQAKKVTTAIVIEADGSQRHIPTRVVNIKGINYAEINSLSNSEYALIHNENAFADMAGYWAEEKINNMGARTAVNGRGNNMFYPEENITRAEFAALVVKGLGIKLYDAENSFIDVPSNAWCSQYIETAYQYGIILGNGDGTFGPNDIITREQAFAMIFRAMRITALDSSITSDETATLYAKFSDSKQVANYFQKEVAVCIKANIVNGRDSTHIVPDGNIKRAEAAVIIYRVLHASNLI